LESKKVEGGGFTLDFSGYIIKKVTKEYNIWVGWQRWPSRYLA